MRHDHPTPTPAPVTGYGTPTQGRALRAWQVRTRDGRTHRVTEHEVERPGPRAAAVVSDCGHPLACTCVRARIHRGRCEHTLEVARRIGGRDVVAEMWAEEDQRTRR